MKCYIKDYPRPQFVRKKWENLNGSWDFKFDDENLGESAGFFTKFNSTHTIQVPFTYETKLSGIQDELPHNYIWYHRTLPIDLNLLKNNNYILHFEGSDFITKVWVNGKFAGIHRGGYTRFSFDITNLLHDGENDLTVKVEDFYDIQQPRGKQRWLNQNFGCHYVQTSGIWKTVWGEYVPKVNLSHVKLTPNLTNCYLDIDFEVNAPECFLGTDLRLETTISFQGTLVNHAYSSILCKHSIITLNLFMESLDSYSSMVRTWTPECPDLYDIEFRLTYKEQILDEVGSYFGLREICIENSNILLNGYPLYQRLILDQGYWKDSHLTPPSEASLKRDIKSILALGYNGVRKHQKIEDERFLYWCDVLGLLVWSEAPSTFHYSDDSIQEFTTEWMEILKQNYNHPCIITWTPFNESWGLCQVKNNREQQHFTEAIYHLTKSFDPYRPVIVNDGWEHTVSDILTLHDYETDGITFKNRYGKCKEQILTNQVYHNGQRSALANGYIYKGQPIIISEYGGIAFNHDYGWGYGEKVNTKEAFIDRFDKITTAIKELPYICGFCYTQITDVQQEINGLMDSSRNFKISPEIIREINERKVGYWNI